MAIILLALPSCRSVNPCLYTLHRDSVAYTVHQTIDTLVIHDSIFVREYMAGDTVYLTRTEYRDRWRTQLVHDTVRDTQYITQTIEHPPERYVPKFYKWSAAALYILLGIGVLIVFLKFRLS